MTLERDPVFGHWNAICYARCGHVEEIRRKDGRLIQDLQVGPVHNIALERAGWLVRFELDANAIEHTCPKCTMRLREKRNSSEMKQTPRSDRDIDAAFTESRERRFQQFMDEPMTKLVLSLVPPGEHEDAMQSLLEGSFRTGFTCGLSAMASEIAGSVRPPHDKKGRSF